jgi:hypothetical protein
MNKSRATRPLIGQWKNGEKNKKTVDNFNFLHCFFLLTNQKPSCKLFPVFHAMM